jgi:hypothetical protein
MSDPGGARFASAARRGGARDRGVAPEQRQAAAGGDGQAGRRPAAVPELAQRRVTDGPGLGYLFRRRPGARPGDGAAPRPGFAVNSRSLMPGKKPPPKDPQPPPGPGWQIILEEILSQNRATIEAVQSSRDELKRDIAELRENTDVRFQVLESAVSQNGADIRQNSADIRVLQRDVRNLAERVDNLSGLEVRVAALERQRG